MVIIREVAIKEIIVMNAWEWMDSPSWELVVALRYVMAAPALV